MLECTSVSLNRSRNTYLNGDNSAGGGGISADKGVKSGIPEQEDNFDFY